MEGDRTETVVDAGDTTRTDEVTAGRTGRGVGPRVRGGVAEVSEVTRTGSAVPASDTPSGMTPRPGVLVSTQGSTPTGGGHPPGGPAIGTRA
ncbi:hypothetical protein [Streptomyces fractus]|uniref:hypothetical protein n=1 Tax=Streptomyces fractus TaxID=641806 RepID=UPI003CF782E5